MIILILRMMGGWGACGGVLGWFGRGLNIFVGGGGGFWGIVGGVGGI